MTRLFRHATLALVGLACMPAGAADRIADEQIARSVQEALNRDFRLKGSEIRVSTLSGSVTLSGTVATFLDKYAAEQLAKRTAGVRMVANMIQVDSAGRRDEEIARDVRRRLEQSSFIRSKAVTVQVANGVVTLTGSLPSWAQSRQAQRVASEVRGVRLVRNKLTLGGRPNTTAPARTDEHIKADVEAELDRDAYLAMLPIEVSVKAGAVRLEGEVPNLFHKDLAGEEARLIANVRTVDNRLVVGSQRMLETRPEPPTDGELQRSVLEELRADPRIGGGPIEVSTLDREVTLRGSVASMFERQTAQRIARRVVGVTRVENLLEVRATGRSDQEICDDTRFNLSSDSLLAGQGIGVAVKDGAVTLSGEVKDFASKYHAMRLTARVRGVRSITNELRVRWSESTDDGFVRLSIVDRLGSNAVTRAIAGRIQVEVNQGAATLTGDVNRSSELIEAERIAKSTDGVRTVQNRLTVVSQPEK